MINIVRNQDESNGLLALNRERIVKIQQNQFSDTLIFDQLIELIRQSELNLKLSLIELLSVLIQQSHSFREQIAASKGYCLLSQVLVESPEFLNSLPHELFLSLFIKINGNTSCYYLLSAAGYCCLVLNSSVIRAM